MAQNLEGDRPPLSVDVVSEFLPRPARRPRGHPVVVDCLRLDQWRVLEPVISPLFDIETTHYFSVLPTATPYARNAVRRALSREIAARFPDWWGSGTTKPLNAHERELLQAQLKELEVTAAVRYDKISSPSDSDELERRLPSAIGHDGVSAFVFNFVDLLTHGRSESAILFEVARDEIALRQLTLQWFQRSALLGVLREAARRKITVVVTSDHGSIHCSTRRPFSSATPPPTCATSLVGDLRAERPEQALLLPTPTGCACRDGLGPTRCWRSATRFSSIPRSCASTRAGIAARSCTAVTPEECIVPLSLLTPK